VNCDVYGFKFIVTIESKLTLLFFNNVQTHTLTVCVDRAEINIKPWDALQKDLDAGNRKVRWIDREPYAYWKGNPDVAAIRQELVKCNVTSKQEWNARIYKQVLVCEYVHYTLLYLKEV
jgi:hypothetical protein